MDIIHGAFLKKVYQAENNNKHIFEFKTYTQTIRAVFGGYHPHSIDHQQYTLTGHWRPCDDHGRQFHAERFELTDAFKHRGKKHISHILSRLATP